MLLTPPCKYNCKKAVIELVPAKDKADEPGKKQSTTGKICKSITNILKGEIGKTKNKTKLDILKGGLKYANEICDAGGAPDLAKITKGLPEADKKRISQKTSSALFDGAADHPDKDFGPDTAKSAATLTGAGGQVLNLKASEPDIKKVSPVTEVSLSGTKLFGGTSNLAAPKQPSVLLASVVSAKTPAVPTASAQTSGSTQKVEAASSPACPEADRMDDLIREYQLSLDYYQKELAVLNSGGGLCKPGSPGYTKITCDATIKLKEELIAKYERWIAEAKVQKDYYLRLCAEQETKCDVGYERVNGNCVPVCTGGKVRNAQGECECPPGQTSAGEGPCKPKGVEWHDFPYGIPGWVGVIALLFGLALLGAGFASGQGLLWLAISAIVSILGFIIGLKQIKDWGKEFNNWRERQGIRDKIKVEADLGKTAKQLQDNGDIPNNERLREIGFTDDELREWKLLE